MSLLEPTITGLIVVAVTALSTWLWRKYFYPELHIRTAIEQGPTNDRKLGFTEPAVKITVVNKSSESIRIKDIRLMFSRDYGAPVALEAPAGRSHRELPANLTSGAEDHWYIPAEKLSDLLRSLYNVPKKSGSVTYNLKLYARCVTGTGKVYKGQTFAFSTNSNSHWS